MIVVFMSEYVLIMGVFIIPFHLLDEPAIHEKGERSVYGSLGDLDAFSPHGGKEFFGIKMTVTGEDLREDSLPLFGELQALPGKKLPEDLLFHRTILMKVRERIQI